MFNSDVAMIMPYQGKNVPHCVIEVNQKCNVSCTACYKDKSGYTKPISLIKNEIEYVLQKRNISSISLAGGEPCLHPHLDEIISFIAEKGIHVQILSNGLILNHELLNKYKEAGLSKIYLHIDSLQRRSDLKNPASSEDVNALRNKIGKRITEHGLQCAIAITLYQDNIKELENTINFLNDSPYFHRLLVTCCTDFRKVVSDSKLISELITPEIADDSLEDQVVRIKQAEDLIIDRFNWRPFAYVSSNQDLKEKRWIFYHAFSIKDKDNNVRTLRLPPTFRRVVRMANKKGLKSKGRYPFGRVMTPKKAIKVLILHAFFSLSLLELFKTTRFLSRLIRKNRKIYQKSIIFQQGPNLTEKGIEYCKDCPDATIRDGKLVPLCTADFLKPKENTASYCI